jgi:hypothetical protein
MSDDRVRDSALSLIYASLDEVNEMIVPERRVEKSPDTALTGADSSLDSLGLINLLVQLEERAVSRYGVSLQLANEIGNPSGPFSTVATLTEHIVRMIRKAAHE